MLYFDSADIYIEAQSTKVAKIKAIQAIQDALLSTALKAAATGNMSEYMLNDGQTIIKTVYRDPADVQKAWQAFETIKQMYLNQVNGRVVRLVDSKNFLRNPNFR